VLADVRELGFAAADDLLDRRGITWWAVLAVDVAEHVAGRREQELHNDVLGRPTQDLVRAHGEVVDLVQLVGELRRVSCRPVCLGVHLPTRLGSP
jgi:hypothetical protein